jgi:hypothetical protein
MEGVSEFVATINKGAAQPITSPGEFSKDLEPLTDFGNLTWAKA